MNTDEDERNKRTFLFTRKKIAESGEPDAPSKRKMNKTENPKEEKIKKAKKSKKPDYKWITTIFVASFAITILLSLLSNNILSDLNIVVALLMLVFFILLGVIFDIIGLAIMTADERQFHSMAARKIDSAKCAIKLIRNAEKLSSFCNDVIGDIAGILSGVTGAAVVVSLYLNSSYNFVANLLVTSLIAALTVSVKAFGKSIAINNNNDIVNIVSKIIYFFQSFRDFKKDNKNEK